MRNSRVRVERCKAEVKKSIKKDDTQPVVAGKVSVLSEL